MPSAVTVVPMMSATEGGSGGVTVYRDGDTSAALTVNLSYGGTAAAGDHNGPSSVVIPATWGSIYLQITATDDSDPEPTESLVITVTSGTGYTVGSPASATMTIFDNETPEVTIEPFSDAAEDGLDGLVKLTRLGDLSTAITVSFSRSGTATVTTDYTSGTSLLIPANSAVAFAIIAAEDDDHYDPGETVIITLTSGTGYTVGTADDATIYIIDSADATFTLESVDGGIKYTIDWDEVDPEEATQSLDVTGFAITVDGETFTAANADFTTDPTAQFEYGEFIGLTFAIDTSSVSSYAYDEVSMSEMTVEAVLAGTTDTVNAQAVVDNDVKITKVTKTFVQGQGWTITMEGTLTLASLNRTYTGTSVYFVSPAPAKTTIPATLNAGFVPPAAGKTVKFTATVTGQAAGNGWEANAGFTWVLTNNPTTGGNTFAQTSLFNIP